MLGVGGGDDRSPSDASVASESLPPGAGRPAAGSAGEGDATEFAMDKPRISFAPLGRLLRPPPLQGATGGSGASQAERASRVVAATPSPRASPRANKSFRDFLDLAAQGAGRASQLKYSTLPSDALLDKISNCAGSDGGAPSLLPDLIRQALVVDGVLHWGLL
jgi:hypothetical protein